MYKFLTILMLFMLPCSIVAEDGKKQEFTEEQLNQLKTTEEKYKDNPGMMKLIQKVKEQAGLTGETVEAQESPPAPPPPEPSMQGDPDIAAEAYKNRDYATALKHYKALAAEGDAEASLKLGTMYEMGQGTEKDSAAAHAWYKKAADEGEPRAKIFLKSVAVNTDMSEEELAKAEKDYEQIVKETGRESGADDKDTDINRDIKFSVLPGAIPGQWENTDYSGIRKVKISPEKFDSTQHAKPALNNEHFQPEKFNRQLPPGTSTDS